MSVSASAPARAAAVADRLAPVAVPVGLAALTWLGLLLVAGFLARLDSLSLFNLVPLFVMALVFWPVVSVAPWREGATGRVVAWVTARWRAFPVVVVLAVLPIVPGVPDLLVRVLQLPYRGGGAVYGATLFYRARFGPMAGRLLFTAAVTYLYLLWLYFVSAGLVGLARRLR